MRHFGQCQAFIGCLTSQNVHDSQARLLEGDLGQVSAALTSLQTIIDHLWVSIPDERWLEHLADPELQPLEFYLNERRERAKTKMDPLREGLATDLSVDGYHAWSHLYNTMVGRMSVEIQRDGAVQTVHGAGVQPLVNPDPALRRTVFEKFEKLGPKRLTSLPMYSII